MRRALAIAVLALGACADRGPSAPKPLAMQPASTVVGSAVSTVITGRDFFLDIDVSWADGRNTGVDSGFRALLGTRELAELVYVDSTELRAVVPTSLAAGVYGLTVVDPAGRMGTLGSAFTVTLTPTPTPTPVDCFDVTTGTDENDAGESANPPHLGAGLSMREAIVLANATPGHDCIRFAGPIVVQPGPGPLPPLTDPMGATIDGSGGAVVDGAQITVDDVAGLELASPNNVVMGLRVRDWRRGTTAAGILMSSSGSRLSDCFVELADIGAQVLGSASTIAASAFTTAETGIYVAAPDVTLDGNSVTDVTMIGVQVGITGARTAILRTRAIRTLAGVAIFDTPDVRVDHLTVHAATYGVGVVGGTNVIVRNAVLTEISDSAIGFSGGSAAVLDWIVFFNAGNPCNGCTTGANVVTADPLYVDVAIDDLTPGLGSPAIDSGTDTGLDVNGPGAGNFNGAAPDRGAIETP